MLSKVLVGSWLIVTVVAFALGILLGWWDDLLSTIERDIEEIS